MWARRTASTAGFLQRMVTSKAEWPPFVLRCTSAPFRSEPDNKPKPNARPTALTTRNQRHCLPTLQELPGEKKSQEINSYPRARLLTPAQHLPLKPAASPSRQAQPSLKRSSASTPRLPKCDRSSPPQAPLDKPTRVSRDHLQVPRPPSYPSMPGKSIDALTSLA